MKQLYILIISLFLFNIQLSANETEGYIVTKDAKIITGNIEQIFYSDWICEITFINDMGTEYVFQPWLIYGFAIKQSTGLVRYESKYEKGHWRFLKVIYKGDNLSLYGCPPQKTRQVREMWGVTKVVWSAKEFWLEPKEKNPIRLFQANFKRKLKKYISDEPDLLDKLGSAGYRFTDLPKIIKEYNQLKKDKEESIRI